MLSSSVVFRQLFCPVSNTFTYLLGCARTREAAIIDGVLGNVDRDLAVARELGVRVVLSLDTHLHADHITSAGALQALVGAKIAISENSGAKGADRPLKEGDVVEVGDLKLQVRATPGHTSGCLTYVLEHKPLCAFTGDALLIRGCGRTDFQQGDAALLYRSVKNKILSLPDDTLIFVGHDYKGASLTTVAEEKVHNPRVGGDASEHDFVTYMTNLNLPHPKQIDEAVPANASCGKAAFDQQPRFDFTWGQVYRTLAGHFEVDPQWLQENLRKPGLIILDVRDDAEVAASPDLKKVPGAQVVPLGEVVKFVAAKNLDKAKAEIITVCRAGARSAQACVLLGRDGYKRCASLPGGMIRWNKEGRTVE